MRGRRFDLAARNLYLFNWAFGPGADYAGIDFGRDYDRYRAALAPDLDAEDDNLDAFAEAGGKMLAYAGTQDACVPCGATLDYFARLAARRGGREAARRFFRLYILPGREHFGARASRKSGAPSPPCAAGAKRESRPPWKAFPARRAKSSRSPRNNDLSNHVLYM